MSELISCSAVVDILHGVTGEVLSTMLSLKALPGRAFSELQPGKSDGVVSFVGLAGMNCVGTGGLECSSKDACRLASALLMSEIEAVDDDVLDAMGELTNMIMGNFKNELELRLGPMGLSVPTVVYGGNFSTRNPGHAKGTVVPFCWGDSRLNVSVCLKPVEAGMFGRYRGRRNWGG